MGKNVVTGKSSVSNENRGTPIGDVYKRQIINICSMMSELGRETVSAYAAAKGGLKMLTKNICSEYGPVSYTHLDVYKRQGSA